MADSKTRTQMINEYIVEHFGRVSNSNIANIFNISEHAVNCRVTRLKAKKLIKKSAKPFLKANNKVEKKAKKVVKKAKKVVKKNKFSNSDGVYKQKARQIMVDAIKLQGTTLSLPFSTCTLEKQILEKNANGFDFVGCEMNMDTYRKMLDTIAEDEVLKNAIKPYYGMTTDILANAKKNSFSNLLLDYCGVLDTYAEEIVHAVKNNTIKAGGAICITLNKRGYQGDSIKNRMLKMMPNDMFEVSCGEIELSTKLFFYNLVANNTNYSIETFFNYQDIKKDKKTGKPMKKENGQIIKRAPMMLIVLRRNK